jgi:hypothetical protein
VDTQDPESFANQWHPFVKRSILEALPMGGG